MVNQMLTKRVLPLALAATAAGWLDYKLGHPSDKVIDLGLKANVLRADLTDSLPGARRLTDLYESTVPGPQYGPLALPAAGAFAGGLLHYQRVLRGKFPTEAARKADSLLFPEMKALRDWASNGKKLTSVEGLAQIWKGLGTPGKGAAIGLAMALPFIPGMLGSRKTGGELRDIYSGQEQVPVRSGRWWELGSTPFEGARIKAWRPHWSILHKARAEDAALSARKRRSGSITRSCIPSAGCAIRTISKSCTTRAKHPFPLFAAFEKHYCQGRISSTIPIYMNRLQ
jgi:hypothetical protein